MIDRELQLRQALHLTGHSVAAVVVAEEEGIVLHRFADLLHIGNGKLVVHGGGQQAGQRLGHEHAGSAYSLIGLDVLNEESRGLFQHSVYHVRVVIAVDHSIGNAHETASQRERPDNAGQYRTVGDEAHSLPDGLYINARAASAYSRNLQGVSFFLGFHNVAHNGGNFVVRDAGLCAESLGFHGEVHHAHGSAGVHPVSNGFHAFGLQGAVHYQLVNCAAQKLNRGEGKDGHGLFHRGSADVFQPFLYVHKEIAPFVQCVKVEFIKVSGFTSSIAGKATACW